jgi:hypothetical protein
MILKWIWHFMMTILLQSFPLKVCSSKPKALDALLNWCLACILVVRFLFGALGGRRWNVITYDHNLGTSHKWRGYIIHLTVQAVMRSFW